MGRRSFVCSAPVTVGAGLDQKADRTVTGWIQDLSSKAFILQAEKQTGKLRHNTRSKTENHDKQTDKELKEHTGKNTQGANHKTRHSWSGQGTGVKTETLRSGNETKMTGKTKTKLDTKQVYKGSHVGQGSRDTRNTQHKHRKLETENQKTQNPF